MSERQRRRTPVTRLKIGLLILATALVTIVIVQNTEAVETQLLFYSFAAPKALLFGICLIVGFLLGLYAGRRWALRNLNKEVSARESDRPGETPDR